MDAPPLNLNDKSGNSGKTESSGDRAAVQQLSKGFQPRSPSFSRRLRGTLNNAFRFQLIFQRNPNAGWGFNFSRELFGGCDDGRKVLNKAAAIAARSCMDADSLRQRREPFILKNGFDVLTLHGTSLRERRHLGDPSHKPQYKSNATHLVRCSTPE